MAAPLEFVVPLYTEDLEVVKSDRYCVHTVLDVEGCDDVDAIIDEVADVILNCDDLLTCILRHDVYDKLYSLVKYWTVLSAHQQQRLVEVFQSTMTDLLNIVTTLSKDPTVHTGDARAKALAMAQRRAPFKAFTYMFTIVVQVAEKTFVPPTAALGGAGKKTKAAVGKGGRGGRGKAPAAAAPAALDDGIDGGAGADGEEGGSGAAAERFDWDSYREACIEGLTTAIGLDLRAVWPMGLPEEEYLSVFCKTGQRLLASPSCMKNKGARARTVELLAIICRKFPTTIAAVAAGLVASITASDHAGAVVAEIVGLWARPGCAVECPAAAAEVMRELGRMGGGTGEEGGAAGDSAAAAGGGASKDTSGLKRAATFLMDATERVPGVVHANLSVLLPYLECESHTMRSALVAALAKIITRTPSAEAAATAAASSSSSSSSSSDGAASASESGGLAAGTRARILDVLLHRIYDVHSLTRAATLKAWATLAAHACIPADETLLRVTRAAGDRLRDKSAMVRKAAGALLRALVENNPYGGSLDASLFKQQQAAAQAWLEAHPPPVAAAPAAADTDASDASGGGDGVAAAARIVADEENRRASNAALAAATGDSAAGSSTGGAVVAVVSAEYAQWSLLAAQCGIAARFCEAVAASVAPMGELLASKTGSDVMESIRFLSRARAFAVPGAEAALALMLTLIWSQEDGVREEVIRTFDRLYILNQAMDDDDGDDPIADDDEAAPAAAPAAAAAGGAGADAEPAPAAAGAASKPAAARAPRGKKAAAATDGAAAAAKAPAAGGRAKRAGSGSTAAKKGGKKATGKKAAGGDDDDDDEDGDDDVALMDDGEDDDYDAAGDAAADDAVADEDDAEEAPAAAPKSSRGAKKAAPKAGKKAGAASSTMTAAAAAAADARARAALDVSQVADNLVNMLTGASLAVQTSLEKVLGEVCKRGLLPADVGRVLWETVAQGVAALTRFRLQGALAMKTFLAAAPGSPAAAAAADAAASTILVQHGAAETALVRSRRAMCIIASLASADASVVDNMPAMGRMLVALQPPKLPPALASAGVFDAAALIKLLEAAAPLPAVAAGGAGTAAAAGAQQLQKRHLLEAALHDLCTGGDYRLARHVCVALQRVPPPVKQAGGVHDSMAAAAAAAAGAAAPAVPPASKPATKGRGAKAAAASDADAASSSLSATGAGLAFSPDRRAETIGKLLAAISDIIRGEWDGTDAVENPHWYAAAQQGLDVIFALAPRPALPCATLLRFMGAAAIPASAVGPAASAAGGGDSAAAPTPVFSKLRLSRLFFAVGHVALKLLIHADGLAQRVKALRIRTVEKQAATAGRAAAAAAATAAAESAAAAGGKAKKGKSADKEPAAAAAAEAGSLEDQLGATAEDEKELELFTLIADRELLGESLIGMFAPLVTAVVQDQLAEGSSSSSSAAAPSASTSLPQSALLTLCKLMCVSASFCDKSLPLLFTVLTHARAPELRASIATALGDLTFRFPNLVEPYTRFLYARLRDNDALVRKNTLMVLSHVILNGMVKIKGQIGEVAVCLHDPEPRIADLTRMVHKMSSATAAASNNDLLPTSHLCRLPVHFYLQFFNELSKRGTNPIYNVLPDTLSCLSRLVREGEQLLRGDVPVTGASAGSLRPLTRESFREIVKFLLGFIGKDKQSEGLTDKLLHRFDGVSDIETVRELAFCLAQLPLNDKSLRRIIESHKLYSRWLGDVDVYEAFSGILAKGKRSVASAKGDLKDAVVEWEAALHTSHTSAAEDDASDAKARALARQAAALAATEGMADALAADAASRAAAAASDAAAAMAEKAAAGKGARGGTRRAVVKSAPAAAASAAAADDADAKPVRKAAPRRVVAIKKKKVADSDDDDDDAGAIEDSDEDDEDIPAAKKKAAPKATAAAARKR